MKNSKIILAVAVVVGVLGIGTGVGLSNYAMSKAETTVYHEDNPIINVKYLKNGKKGNFIVAGDGVNQGNKSWCKVEYEDDVVNVVIDEKKKKKENASSERKAKTSGQVATLNYSFENEKEIRNAMEQIKEVCNGLPYKYGGENLEEGTDCSGFVKSIFMMGGIELPGSIAKLSTVGKEVSMEQMKPGDLVIYGDDVSKPEHCGIYLGDKKVIHSSNDISGVIISDVNYRNILCIRDVIRK